MTNMREVIETVEKKDIVKVLFDYMVGRPEFDKVELKQLDYIARKIIETVEGKKVIS